MSTAPDKDPARLWDLLHAGDWACAHGDDEALARASGQLAGTLEPRLARVAERIQRLAAYDLAAASTLWGQLASRLR